MQIFRLDERVVQLDLFIAVDEFFLELRRPGADAIGDQLLEFFLKHALPDAVFEFRYGHLRAGLH